jgi:1,4-dihydroxy-2-naphthoyl-CoA hydrolase
MIWKRQTTLEALNAMGEGNMVGLLDIQFDRIGDDSLEATMPVDHRTSRLACCTAGHRWCWLKRLDRSRAICAPKVKIGWLGLRLTLTIFVPRAAAGCVACAKRCMPGDVIRFGKLRSLMNRAGYAARRG